MNRRRLRFSAGPPPGAGTRPIVGNPEPLSPQAGDTVIVDPLLSPFTIKNLTLRKVMDLKAGQTLLFENTPQDPVSVRCGDVPLAEGLMGRRGSAISVRVVRAFKRSDAHAARGSAPA